MDVKRFFTVSDMAAFYDVHASHVRAVASAHGLGVKVHRFLRVFDWDDVVRFKECRAPKRGPYRRRGVRRQSPPVQVPSVRAVGEPVEFSPEFWR